MCQLGCEQNTNNPDAGGWKLSASEAVLVETQQDRFHREGLDGRQDSFPRTRDKMARAKF